MVNNIAEVQSRGARVLVLANEEAKTIEGNTDWIFSIPKTASCFAGILSAIPLQLFAYYVAVAKGCDVDQPRNLAKSVTVE